MLKIHIILFVCCFTALNVLCIDDLPGKELKKDIGLQVGIDATFGFSLLTNILGNDYFDLNDIGTSNYFFFVKYKFLRLQAGTDFSGFFPENPNTNYSYNVEERVQNSFRLKLGAEYTKALNSKFNFFAGGSVMYNHFKREQKRNFTLQYGEDVINDIDITHQFGPGVHCGVEWFVAKKISLSTETNFNFLIQRDINTEVSEIFPDDLGTEEVNKSYQSEYQFPFLNILIRFKI